MREFSSVPIKTEVLIITSEHPYYADQFEIKPQAKISPFEKILEETEEELTPLTKSDGDKNSL